MTTLAKIDANRRNGALSNGPKTMEGRIIVTRNAIKHGIFAAVPVIPGECPMAWDEHRVGVVASLTPVGLLEVNLTERVALLLWRLQRVARYEVEMATAVIEALDVPPLPPVEEEEESDYISDATAKKTRDEQLRDLRREMRSAREQLTRIVPARDYLGLLLAEGSSKSISAAVARTIFRSAFTLVVSFKRREDPPHFGTESFWKSLGMSETEPQSVDRTADFIQRGLAHYGTFIGQTPDGMVIAVRTELDEDIEELTRTVRRLEAEIAAIVRLLDGRNARHKAMNLMPKNGRDERIAKYERHLHTLLTSTLHELERLQARREGEPVAAPIVADVNVTIDSGEG
jgi:hypothetical protein